MTTAETKDGRKINLGEVTKVKLLESSIDIINPLWVIVWVLIFFPMAIALVIAGFSNKKYTCVVTINGDNEVLTFDKANYHLLNISSI